MVDHDVRAGTQANAAPLPGLFDFSRPWAVIGFFASAALAFVIVYGYDLGRGWPTAARIGVVLLAAAFGSGLIGRLGQLMFHSFWLVVGIVLIVSSVGSLVATFWYFF